LISGYKDLVRDYSFASLSQSLLRVIDEQVQATPSKRLRNPLSGRTTDGQGQGQGEGEKLQLSGWEALFCVDKARGNEKKINQSLMARKQSFLWVYLEGDSHLRGYYT